MVITPEFKPEGKRFEMFKKVAAAGKANGSVMVAQITHPGRQLQYRVSQVTVAPSDVPMGKFAKRIALEHGLNENQRKRMASSTRSRTQLRRKRSLA